MASEIAAWGTIHQTTSDTSNGYRSLWESITGVYVPKKHLQTYAEQIPKPEQPPKSSSSYLLFEGVFSLSGVFEGLGFRGLGFRDPARVFSESLAKRLSRV